MDILQYQSLLRNSSRYSYQSAATQWWFSQKSHWPNTPNPHRPSPVNQPRHVFPLSPALDLYCKQWKLKSPTRIKSKYKGQKHHKLKIQCNNTFSAYVCRILLKFPVSLAAKPAPKHFKKPTLRLNRRQGVLLLKCFFSKIPLFDCGQIGILFKPQHLFF